MNQWSIVMSIKDVIGAVAIAGILMVPMILDFALRG